MKSFEYEPDDGDTVVLSVVERGISESTITIRINKRKNEEHFHFTVDGRKTVYLGKSFIHMLSIFTYMDHNVHGRPRTTIVPKVLMVISRRQFIKMEEVQNWVDSQFTNIQNECTKRKIDLMTTDWMP